MHRSVSAIELGYRYLALVQMKISFLYQSLARLCEALYNMDYGGNLNNDSSENNLSLEGRNDAKILLADLR